MKCDEGKPECSRCLAIGVSCKGYKPASKAERLPPSQKPLLPRMSTPNQPHPTPLESSSFQSDAKPKDLGTFKTATAFGLPGTFDTSLTPRSGLQLQQTKLGFLHPKTFGQECECIRKAQEQEENDPQSHGSHRSSVSKSSPSSQRPLQLQTPPLEPGKPGHTHDCRAITLCRPPSTSIFDNEDEHRYFRFFTDKTVAHIGGCYNPLLWNQSVLQACEGERSILYAAIAIGALDLSFKTGRSSSISRALGSISKEDEAIAHYRFSLREMNKAIKQMRQTVQKKQDLRTTLLASILIIAFEIYHGNHESALDQIRSSVQLLEDWTAPHHCSLDSAGAGISPSPHTVEDDLVHAFYRLEIEGMVYIDQLPVSCHLTRKNDRAAAVQTMPSEFERISEAQVFGKILMRRTIHFLVVAWTYDRGAQQPDNNMYVLDKIRCNASPQSLAELDGYRKEMARWYAAFTPLLDRATSSRQTKDRYSAICLQVHYLCTCVAMDCVFRENEMFFDTLKSTFTSILSLTKILLDQQDDSFFVFDSQVILPLEIVGKKCRDPAIRREAIRLMYGVKRREGFMDSLVLAKVCSWIVSVEEEGMVGNYVPEEARARNLRAEPGEEKGSLRVWCELPRIGGEPGEVVVRDAIIK